jgi:hypothetical protein
MKKRQTIQRWNRRDKRNWNNNFETWLRRSPWFESLWD